MAERKLRCWNPACQAVFLIGTDNDVAYMYEQKRNKKIQYDYIHNFTRCPHCQAVLEVDDNGT